MVDLPVALAEGTELPVHIDSELPNTPAVLITLDIVDRNIERMAACAQCKGLALRPHVKTHKSPDMPRWQLDDGAVGNLCRQGHGGRSQVNPTPKSASAHSAG